MWFDFRFLFPGTSICNVVSVCHPAITTYDKLLIFHLMYYSRHPQAVM